MTAENALSRSQSLVSKRTLEDLFASGRRVKGHPISARFLILDDHPGVQVAFSAPKRKYGRAVDRNRAKRMMRELYRRHQGPLIDLMREQDKGLALFLVFLGDPYTDLKRLETRFVALMQQLIKETKNVDA